jgi:8-oxo-dGTP diphosphatase
LTTHPLHDGEPGRQICGECGRVHYRNAKPTASVLVTRDGRVMLVRRGIEPAKGAWDIPGGFLEANEHPAAGAARELREETGLDITLTGLFGIYMDRYGHPDDCVSTLNIVYLATAPVGEPCPADDAVEIGWFTPDDVPEELAFPHQRAVMHHWRQRHDPTPSL